jgi:FkbM family methyltransferase
MNSPMAPTMNSPIQEMARGVTVGLQSVFSGSAAVRCRARRRLALGVLKRLRSEITFRRQGFLWTGSTASTITQTIFLEEHYQDAHLEPLTAWLQAHTDFARPFIVNVGANIGDVALPLTRTGKRVVAVEPNPETFVRLQRNVRQNGLADRVTCCESAISTEGGTAELVLARDAGNSEINVPDGRLGFDGVDERKRIVPVKTARLDALLESLHVASSQVALVWSDTQGFESQVIASAPALWQNGTPLWVEIWPKGLACHGGIQSFLDLCQRHFRRLLPGCRFEGEPESINALEPITAGLKGAEFTDVLLLP